MDKLRHIITSFFSTEAISSEIDEDFSEVRILLKLCVSKFPSLDLYKEFLEQINERDTFHISIKKDDEVIENFTNRTDENFESYVSIIRQDVQPEDIIELILTIEKNIKKNRLSIYFLDEFTKKISNLSFLTFLSLFDDKLSKGVLLFECLEINASEPIFSSHTIQFIGKEEKSSIKEFDKEIRDKRIETASFLCLWDISEKKPLLPDDFFPIQVTPKFTDLVKVFLKVSILYTAVFIFDYLSVKEKVFSYKLNGYKTFGNKILTSKVSEIKIDINSASIFYEIYQWIYSGGNTSDKMSIARNIISLNFDPESLKLSDTTFDSILSSFKIFERQSVQQYIEVRNKLSELLINLQEKIDKIVSNFINDFKKNIVTLLTFFTSVIVLRVISKGDFIGGFTNEIIVLSYGFLLISVGILIYSRWELSKRIALFDKHYGQLKNRYKELLTENELNKVFDEQDPKKLNNKSFVENQKKLFTILWIVSICILAIALGIIYDDFLIVQKLEELLNRVKLSFQC